MNRAHKIYENQLSFYNENKDKFFDLTSDTIDFNKYYKDLYFNIDKDFNRFDDIDKLIREEKFSPLRKAYLTSDYKEITKSPNFEKAVITLLQLGFDLSFTTSKYNKTTEEILKTSCSEVKLRGFHFPWNIKKSEFSGKIL